MLPFITLSCPSCGGKLQITNDTDRFACAHCGQEHMVKRAGGIVTLSPVVEALQKVQIGVDRTASELAIVRLERELATLKAQRNIILDKKVTKPSNTIFHIFAWLSGIAFLLVGLFTYDYNGAGPIILGIILVLIGFWVQLRHKSALQSQETIQGTISSIDRQIKSVESEIEKHRSIVTYKN